GSDVRRVVRLHFAPLSYVQADSPRIVVASHFAIFNSSLFWLRLAHGALVFDCAAKRAEFGIELVQFAEPLLPVTREHGKEFIAGRAMRLGRQVRSLQLLKKDVQLV